MNSLIEHVLEFRAPTGQLITSITDKGIVSLAYALKENEPGVLDLALPGDFEWTFIPIDGQIEIYRSYGGGTLRREGDTTWFIRERKRATLPSGENVITLQAYSALHIASRRIVAYYAGTSYTDKVGIYWDDLLREVVRENYGSAASDTTRNLSPWLTVEDDRHYGASYSRSIPWREVLLVLQDICNDVRSNGQYASFDMVRTDPGEFEFRVFIGARGNDHSSDSANPLIVSEEHHNLADGLLDDSWIEEKNFIYAAGQGQETDRVVETAQDDTRIGISPFNRMEYLRDCRQAVLPAHVQAEANGALEEMRPKKIFTGTILQTEGSLYGVHWGWGDIVTAEYQGESFDCHVNTVAVSIDQDGTEHVQGLLRSESDA